MPARGDAAAYRVARVRREMWPSVYNTVGGVRGANKLWAAEAEMGPRPQTEERSRGCPLYSTRRLPSPPPPPLWFVPGVHGAGKV